VTQRRAPWLVTGALAGVSAASVLVAAMLWMTRDSLPEKAQTPDASASTGTVTAVVPPPTTQVTALEPVLFVKVELAPPVAMTSPEPKVEQPPAAIAQPAAPVAAKAEPVKPREPAQAVQARRAPAVTERPARHDIEDPTLADTEEEIPFMQQPEAARAPEPVAVAEPAPPSAPKPSEYDELDRKFAQELGFTDDAVQKQSKPSGVTSVWIPPAPGESLPQTLKPEDIQQVVATHQPLITSCIRLHKDAIPGLKEGKFVMRWFIHPSGSTYQVAMETQSLRGTAMATCIEGVVRGWKFPKHQTQMEPIRFPFIF
jgi:hypothetical protein